MSSKTTGNIGDLSLILSTHVDEASVTRAMGNIESRIVQSTRDTSLAQRTALLRNEASSVAGRAGKMGGAFQELGRGIEDVLVSASMAKNNIDAIAMGLRGGANNAAQMASYFGPVVGASVAIGASLATVIVPMTLRWLYNTEAIEQAQKKANEAQEEWIKLRREGNELDEKRVEKTSAVQFMAERKEEGNRLQVELNRRIEIMEEHQKTVDKLKAKRGRIGIRSEFAEERESRLEAARFADLVEHTRQEISMNDEVSEKAIDSLKERQMKERDEFHERDMAFRKSMEDMEAEADIRDKLELKHQRELSEYNDKAAERTDENAQRGRDLLLAQQQRERDKPFEDELKKLEDVEGKKLDIRRKHQKEWDDTMLRMANATDEQREKARGLLTKKHARENAEAELDAKIAAKSEEIDALQERMQRAGNAAGPSAALISGTQAAESAINSALSGSRSVENDMKSLLKVQQDAFKVLQKTKQTKVASLTN